MNEPGASGQVDGRTDGQGQPSTLSIDAAATRLDTTARNVRRYIAERKLAAIPDPNGRGRVVLLSSVEAWEAEAKAEAKRTDGRTDTRTQNNDRPPVHEDLAAQLLDQLRSENEFLRARNAELNAVVMQQARALESAQHRAALVEATAKPQQAPNAPVEPMTAATSSGPQRGATGFWMRARRLARELLR